MGVNYFKSYRFNLCHILFLTCLKGGTFSANKKMQNRIYSGPAVKGLTGADPEF